MDIFAVVTAPSSDSFEGCRTGTAGLLTIDAVYKGSIELFAAAPQILM